MQQSIHAHLVLISVEILVNGSRSLKTKRAVINRVRDRLRSRFNASVAEIGYHDKWQRAVIGITMISNEKKKLQKDVDAVQTMLLTFADVTIGGISVEWL